MMLIVPEQSAIRSKMEIEQLVHEHYDRVFKFCSARVGYHLAGDAAQETFLVAQIKLNRFRGESSVRTWLLGIARLECQRINQKHHRESNLLDIHWKDSEEGRLLDRDSLTRALEQLSEEHREVILLHELDDLSYEEIGKLLAIPIGTVKSRMHYAFDHLRRLLGPTFGLATQPTQEPEL